MITIRVDSQSVVDTLDNLATKQLDFALARAINAVGQDFEVAQRARMREIFILRGNPAWATGPHSMSVKRIGPAATKGRPTITMGIDPKADFLEKFEEGVTKTPTQGEDIAIPDDIRSDVHEILKPSQRPRALLDDAKADNVFIVRPGDDSRLLPGIWQRTANHGLQRLFALARSVPTPRELGFEDTARQTVNAMWAQRFSEAFTEALKKAKDGDGSIIDATPMGTVDAE